MRVLLALFVMAGCGGDDKVHHLPDAPPPPDGAPDAASPEVTLTVIKDGTPVANVTVYFQNADSTVVSTATTDTSGVASARMAAGGFVTAVNPFLTVGTFGGPLPDDLRTFAGVAPGDHLRLDATTTTAIANLTVIVPPDPDAFSYDVLTTCGSTSISSAGSGSSSTAQLAMFNCGGVADVVIQSRGIEGDMLHTLYHPDATVTDGGTLDLSAETYATPASATFTYTHAPVSAFTLGVSSRLISPHGQVVETAVATSPVSGAATITMKQPAITGALDVVDTFFDVQSGRHHVIDWGPAATAYTLDLTGIPLTDIMDFPVFDAASHAVTWTQGPAGVAADFAVTGITVTRPGKPSRNWNWQIAAPFTIAAVALPTVPTDIFDFNVGTSDLVNVQQLLLGKVPGGYAAVRPTILDPGGPNGFVAGATGRAIAVEAQLLGK